MIKAFISFFGLKGSFKWACRQIARGKILYRLRDSGIVYFSYDKGRRKINAIIWWETSTEGHEWGIAMEDVFATDFKVLPEKPDYANLHHQSQMKTTD